jgi:hypothetical protein
MHLLSVREDALLYNRPKGLRIAIVCASLLRLGPALVHGDEDILLSLCAFKPL